jgi:hypothetical protein
MNALLWTIIKFMKVFFGSVGLGGLTGCITALLVKI